MLYCTSFPILLILSLLPGVACAQGLIQGFPLGLLGMYKSGHGVFGVIGGDGETKSVLVPPELAYGTDPNANPMGGVTLIFKLTVKASE